jgi:hypothetical protein
MKRESEEIQLQEDMEQSNPFDPSIKLEMQDDVDDSNELDNLTVLDGGGNPPAKRLRRSEDEEVRLLIPSKVIFVKKKTM